MSWRLVEIIGKLLNAQTRGLGVGIQGFSFCPAFLEEPRLDYWVGCPT